MKLPWRRGGDTIQQTVNVTGSSQAGNISLVGKIENVIKVIREPAQWQDAAWGFFTREWIFVLSCLFLLGAVFVVYLRYKNLFLIPVLPFLVIEILVIFSVWGVNLVLKRRITKTSLLVCSLGGLALIGVSGWVAYPIANPPVFPADKFVIAVATLGEGANYALSNTAREISDQVYNGLCTELQQQMQSGAEADPCSGAAGSSSPILVYPVGVIASSPAAEWYARRIGADVVVWGQVLTSGHSTTIRFQIDETLDKAVNPEFQVVMPVTNNFSEVINRELNYPPDQDQGEIDPVRIKEATSGQITYVSSFALGLFEYLRRDFPRAVEYFGMARQVATAMPLYEQCRRQPAGGDLNCKSLALLYFYLGRSYNGMGKFDLGQPILLEAHQFNPEEPAILISLAIGYGSLAQNNERDNYLKEAMDTIESWRSSHTRNLDAALYDRGVVYQILRKYPDSVLDFQTVIENNPGYYVAYLNLANSYAEMGDTAQAVQTLNEAIALSADSNGNPAWAHLSLAGIQKKSGQVELARREYLQAIGLAPDSPTMYYEYGKFLNDQKQVAGAQAAFNMMVKTAWDKGGAYAVLGEFELGNGLYREAVDSFTRAIHDGRDQDPLLHTRLAQAYLRLGQDSQARAEFETAAGLPTASYYSFAEYAGFLFEQQDYERAVDLYLQALQRDPNEASTLLNLAWTYQKLDQPCKAAEIYNRMIDQAASFSADAVKNARDRLQSLDCKP
jgi:tetratricopeptide (TPR) repeat protein